MTELTIKPVQHMNIVARKPPNFAQVSAAFPNASDYGVLFCFGDTIYNPSNVYIPPELIEHEAVHSARQLADYWKAKDGREWVGSAWTPDTWWKRYIEEPEFRFSEELFAHRAEMRAFVDEHGKKKIQCKRYLDLVAGRLSGPLYGSMTSIANAKKLILGEDYASSSAV